MPITWDENSDRELMFAIFLTGPAVTKDGQSVNFKITWAPVVEQMKEWGHTDATPEAVRGRWKRIFGGFKESHGDKAETDGAAGSAPQPRTPGAKRTRKTDDPKDDDGNYDTQETSAKKKQKKAPVSKKTKKTVGGNDA